MSFAFDLGKSIGSAAASVVHGTRVGSSQLAAGTREGYKSRAEELLAKRQALLAQAKAAAPKAARASRKAAAA